MIASGLLSAACCISERYPASVSVSPPFTTTTDAPPLASAGSSEASADTVAAASLAMTATLFTPRYFELVMALAVLPCTTRLPAVM